MNKVSEEKLAVAKKIKEFVMLADFYLLCASATDSYDIALANEVMIYVNICLMVMLLTLMLKKN